MSGFWFLYFLYFALYSVFCIVICSLCVSRTELISFLGDINTGPGQRQNQTYLMITLVLALGMLCLVIRSNLINCCLNSSLTAKVNKLFTTLNISFTLTCLSWHNCLVE